MVTQLSILTAVLDGHAGPLRSLIEELPVGDASPFAKVTGTHNGRWTVVATEQSPKAPLRAGGLPRPMLMCSAVIDPQPDVWLASLLSELGSTAEDIWSHCAGWPGIAACAPWLLGHRITPWLTFSTWDAPVGQMTSALAVSQRAERFAIATQGLSAEQLIVRYREEFCA